MSKSYQKNQKRQPQLAPEDIQPIQIDETILTGSTNRSKGNQQQQHQQQHLMLSMENVLEQMETLGLLDPEKLMQEFGEVDREEFEDRIKTILETKIIEVDEPNLNRYLQYLQKNIQKPCYLTGSEEFLWEEDYLFGEGSQKKYEKLKKTQPSYTDVFTLVKFSETLSDVDGLLAEVQRVSDQKMFVLPLADLEVTDENSPNYKLIEDYLMWFLNYM
ncbi:calcium binding family protein [Lyngbya aestuarii BL J]|uniref:Calcium binding family protein n=1 Tax=Lyngbya aestuarii BL J TaxID=1348334 RepID=U7QAB5_9CYAN|nr:calcium-binding family protein [Lyngbya aestuarii]ERT04784.1 calcium binding family protein [Lyngbya aestuarii BL J]